MEKNHPPDKFNSFGKNDLNNNNHNNSNASPKSPQLGSSIEVSISDSHSRQGSTVVDIQNHDDPESHDIEQVSQDIDRFTDNLAAASGDKSNLPEVPDDAVETLSKIIESRIAKYNSGGRAARNSNLWKMTEEDSFFIEAVRRISKLTNAISEFSSSSTASDSLNRTSAVLQRAMAFMEEELRALLEDSTDDSICIPRVVSTTSSLNTRNDDRDRCALQGENESAAEDDYPAYSAEIVTKMSRIASAMISAGYETECCQVYSISRRNAFNEQLKKLEYEKINMDDIWRMNWEALENEIKRWNNVVRNCSRTLFPGEKRLAESVFTDHPMISRSIFSNLARSVAIQLLDFAEAVSMTKRSAEKLFKFLDMYETLRELIPAITDSCSDHCEHEIKSEITAAGDRIGEAAVNIFIDLENSIKNDIARNPVPGGAVHPLTRYVMNYLKYACEYKVALEQIFEQHAKVGQSLENGNKSSSENISSNNNTTECESESPVAGSAPFSKQLVRVMDLLDANLEAKSRLYKDPSLRYVFLMNNGRYILQKVKGSVEVGQVMGENWCRRRSTIVRQFHKSYQRESWVRLLHTINHDGLQVNGKVNKPILKERFKNFNSMFDEIHKTQSTWVVSDEQLQSELRVAISAVVIPAYRSFLGRFRQYLDNSKQIEKYIKYQPEDLETLIEDLFDGNPTSMARRRT